MTGMFSLMRQAIISFKLDLKTILYRSGLSFKMIIPPVFSISSRQIEFSCWRKLLQNIPIMFEFSGFLLRLKTPLHWEMGSLFGTAIHGLFPLKPSLGGSHSKRSHFPMKGIITTSIFKPEEYKLVCSGFCSFIVWIPAFAGMTNPTSKFKYERYKLRDSNWVNSIRNHLFLTGDFYLRGDLR